MLFSYLFMIGFPNKEPFEVQSCMVAIPHSGQGKSNSLGRTHPKQKDSIMQACKPSGTKGKDREPCLARKKNKIKRKMLSF